MFGGTWTDLIVGLDVHFELVPMPAPTPVPIPQPFIGMVFDPAGMVMEAVTGAIIDLAHGRPPAPPAGKVFINGLPVLTTSDTGTNALTLMHLPLPPGTGWAPVPRAPNLKRGKRGKAGKAASPTTPPGDAVLQMGSKTVQMMGASAVRGGVDRVWSCSDPARLPTATVLGFPKGRPVLVGGPPAVDWGEAAGRLIATHAPRLFRTKWVAGKLHRLVSRWAPERLRNIFHKSVCFLTGHPVDVASGRVLTTFPGFSLPGPLPVEWQPEYASSWAHRRGALGHGWSHPFEQAIWTELGKVIYQAEDGREIEFSTLDLPEHRAWVGTEIYEPVSQLTLRSRRDADHGHYWEIETHDGLTHELRRIEGELDGSRMGLARVVETRNRVGYRRRFEYEAGRLARVHDGVGRTIQLQYNRQGLLERVYLPDPHRATEVMLQHRFEYSKAGDLVAAYDPLGFAYRYEYEGEHLLVRETNRNGLSFYFGYDGADSSAKCVRTWGDGGIYDHEIDYVPGRRFTLVTDSLGATTAYELSAAGAVVKITDPFGAETVIEYDGDLRVLVEAIEVERGSEGPSWAVMRRAYDERGNEISTTDPLGKVTRREFDSLNKLTRYVNEVGAEWTWAYDRKGRCTEATDPMGGGTTFEYEDHAVHPTTARELPLGRIVSFTFDRHANVSGWSLTDGGAWTQRWDSLGRLIEQTNPLGGLTRIDRDLSGRPTTVIQAGDQVRARYDAEGNVVEVATTRATTTYTYGGHNWLVSRREGSMDAEVTLSYDREGRLTEVRNEAGDSYRYVRDARGDVIEEVTFDGLRYKFRRNLRGSVVEVTSPTDEKTTLGRDLCDRILEIRRPDDRSTFTWRGDGALIAASNGTGSVAYERDPLGRATLEQQGDHWVATYYNGPGPAYLKKSSLALRAEMTSDPHGALRALRAGASDAAAPLEIEWTRDHLGLETQRRLPTGVVARTSRDATGRPLAQQIAAGDKRLGERSYEWRGDRLAALADSHLGRTSFSHDDRGRLATARPEGLAPEFRVPDLVGNVYRSEDRSDRRYGHGGRPLEISGRRVRIDDGGRVSSLPTADGELALAYHSSGLLKEARLADGRQLTYEYDALGRRVAARLDGAEYRRWIWDGDVLLHEIGPDGETLMTVVTEPESWTPAVVLGADGVELLLTDQVGAPMCVVDAGGRLRAWVQIDSFGDLRTSSEVEEVACTPLPWRWPGQYRDDETGLVYNGFRYYSSETGTYLSPDPLRLLGNLDPFAYVSDPLVFADPLGLIQEIIVASMKEALRKGAEFAQVPRVSRGGRKIDIHEVHETSRGRRWQSMVGNPYWQRRGVGRELVVGEASVAYFFLHPDGHPTMIGPGHPDHHRYAHGCKSSGWVS